MEKINVIKNTGEEVWFDPMKLRQSLLRSGANESVADDITNVVCRGIVDGMTTHNIYKHAYQLLRKRSGKVAGRYKLKKAIFEMGPTGYPFERLVSQLIKSQGFSTESGIIMQGKCVQHEVDVFAKNENKVIFVECKFHNDTHKKSDVKVSLYVKSRFEDLVSKYQSSNSESLNYEGWVVTNTRFTTDATDYGSCSGLKLISWDYPKNGNLRDMIDQAGFHPITTMSSITKKEKTTLLENDVILCRQISENTELLAEMGLTERKILKVVKEANQIVES